MSSAICNMLTRRSIRKFKSDMPSREDISKIIEAGTFAANSRGRQATIIIAVTNKEMRDKISKVNCELGGWDSNFDPFYGAPVILIVLGDKSVVNRVYDGSCVMQNMMLAAHELNLGSCWIHRAKEEFEQPIWQEWLKTLGVEGEYEGIAHCAVGYVDGDYPKAPERKPNRVYWVE